MVRILFGVLIAFFLALPANAEELSPSDKSKMQDVISEQLDAFRTGDGPKAYSYAAPLVTNIFPTVDIFMGMVKRGYEPIFRNTKKNFGVIVTDKFGRPAQHVTITASDGKRYEAIYILERQKDGSWKIAGVQMVEIPGLDV